MPVSADARLEIGVEIIYPELVNIYGCSIGKNTRIGPFVEIQSGVVIGRVCKISSHSFICSGVTIGDGVFVGHGFMVLGIGPDVLEPLMSAVRNPPEGEASLRGGDLVKRASALMPAEQCIYYQVTDFDRYLKTMRQTISSLFDLSTSMRDRQMQLQFQVGQDQGGQKLKSDEEGAKISARVEELLPTDEELEGTAGVSVGHLIVNQHGLAYRGAVELPPQ